MGPGPQRLQCRLFVDTESGTFLSETRVRLLEAIESHGSITHAAKRVGLSYKAAWDQVACMNRLACTPVVERSTGGRDGGGSRLTPYGRRLIAFYRAVESDYRAALAELAGYLDAASEDCNFRYLLRRRGMKAGLPARRNADSEGVWK